MKLLYQSHSPYARKVLVMAHEIGLADTIDVIHHETSPTQRNDDVFAKNPLGKVPVLITDNGQCLFDSIVICEYLDGLHKLVPLIPPGGSERWRALKLQAVAQGLADAGIAIRWEMERRPSQLRYQAFADGQTTKLIASYDYLEQAVEFDGTVTIGFIALATTLDWLAFRNLPDFRPSRPRLTKWFDTFCKRRSMLATPLSGDTHD